MNIDKKTIVQLSVIVACIGIVAFKLMPKDIEPTYAVNQIDVKPTSSIPPRQQVRSAKTGKVVYAVPPIEESVVKLKQIYQAIDGEMAINLLALKNSAELHRETLTVINAENDLLNKQIERKGLSKKLKLLEMNDGAVFDENEIANTASGKSMEEILDAEQSASGTRIALTAVYGRSGKSYVNAVVNGHTYKRLQKGSVLGGEKIIDISTEDNCVRTESGKAYCL